MSLWTKPFFSNVKTVEGRNELFPFLMGILLVAGGSASTIFYFIAAIFVIFLNPEKGFAAIWADVLVLYKQFPFLFVLPLFVISLFMFSIIRTNTDELLETLASHFQLLCIVPLAVGLKSISENRYCIDYFIYGLRIGIMVILPVAVLQLVVFDTRPEGFSGNSLIFAFVLCLACVLGLLSSQEQSDRSKLIYYVPSICAFFMIMASFSRAPMLSAFALTGATLSIYVRKQITQKRFFALLSLFVILLALGLAAIASTSFGSRYLDKRIIEPVTNLANGDLSDNSIRKRLDLNISGFYAFTQQPFSGYGLQNTVQAANDASKSALGKKTDYSFSHLHNEYLTYGVAGGIFILVQYLVIISIPYWLGGKGASREFSVLIVLSFATIALTNVVLSHDITSTFFSVCVILLLLNRLNDRNDIDFESREPNLRKDPDL